MCLKTLITTTITTTRRALATHSHINMDRDSLPRVPDTHGDVVDEKLFSDLYIRTSWVDAQVALDQIDKVSAQKDLLSLKRTSLHTHRHHRFACVCVRACVRMP